MDLVPITKLAYLLITLDWLFVSVIVGSVTLFADLVVKKSPKYEKGKVRNKVIIVLSALITGIMLFSFGLNLTFIKGVFLLLVCIYACISDIEERRMYDCVSLLIFAFGFIGLNGKEVITHSIAGLCMFGFLFLCAVISDNRLGGADIKFASAFTFVLGLQKAIPALMLGLLASVIGTPIRNRIQKSTIKTKKEKQTMALVPYLAAGFLCMFIL